MFCLCSDTIMKRACFVSLHQGHRAALSRVGVLRNYLCPVGEHQGLAVTAGPAPSNREASCEPRPAPVSFSKVKLSPKRTLPGDAGRAGQRLQSPLLYLGVWNRVGAQRNALCCYKAGGSSTGSREGIQLLTQQQPLKPEAPCPLQAFSFAEIFSAAGSVPSWGVGAHRPLHPSLEQEGLWSDVGLKESLGMLWGGRPGAAGAGGPDEREWGLPVEGAGMDSRGVLVTVGKWKGVCVCAEGKEVSAMFRCVAGWLCDGQGSPEMETQESKRSGMVPRSVWDFLSVRGQVGQTGEVCGGGGAGGGQGELETGQDWRGVRERPAKRWLGKSREWIRSPRTVWMEHEQTALDRELRPAGDDT